MHCVCVYTGDMQAGGWRAGLSSPGGGEGQQEVLGGEEGKGSRGKRGDSLIPPSPLQVECSDENEASKAFNEVWSNTNTRVC